MYLSNDEVKLFLEMNDDLSNFTCNVLRCVIEKELPIKSEYFDLLIKFINDIESICIDEFSGFGWISTAQDCFDLLSGSETGYYVVSHDASDLLNDLPILEKTLGLVKGTEEYSLAFHIFSLNSLACYQLIDLYIAQNNIQDYICQKSIDEFGYHGFMLFYKKSL